jgi:thiosulfate dehydrogenase [quinone] large subunit
MNPDTLRLKAEDTISLNRRQQIALVVLRTLVGWHFLYEGYVKLLNPAWARDGHPLAAWSSAGYLKSASGPFADLFHSLGAAAWVGRFDVAIAVLLIAVGLSLMLGWFTQLGCVGAMGLLALFYVSAIPLGLPESHAEGTYLIVNKNLIELVSVGVIFAFRTGQIAGLDAWSVRSRAYVAVKEATV